MKNLLIGILTLLVIGLGSYIALHKNNQNSQSKNMEMQTSQSYENTAATKNTETPPQKNVKTVTSSLSTESWKTYEYDNNGKGQNGTQYAYSIKYPSDWVMSTYPGYSGVNPYDAIFSAEPTKTTWDRSSMCVQLSTTWGPIRTDNADPANTLISDKNQTQAAPEEGKMLSIVPVLVNGRTGVESEVIVSGESKNTWQDQIVGGLNYINKAYPGEFHNVYLLSSCPGTSKEVFDAIVSSLKINS